MTKNILKLNKIIHHFWLDHLEIFWTFKDEKLFDKLDFDNSNYGEFNDYIIEKHQAPKYAYKITFKQDNYTLFAYYKWKEKAEKQPVATKDYITIYSTAFKLLEYEEILGFIEHYLTLKHCRRFDICLDLRFEINELLNNYFEKIKTWREFKKSWKIETRYYWEMKNSKNKRQLIRVYNKKLDILEKRKFNLYWDYLLFENMTRVELEIRQELAKVRNYNDVFDNKLLIWIFKNYLYKYTKIFEEFPWEKITLYRAPKVKLDDELYQSLVYKTKKEERFISSAKTIFNLWFCPIRVLLCEWYIKEKTRLALWIEKIEDLINKEKKLIDRAFEDRYFRENTEKVLSNFYKYGKF
jgi:hypothetical protein